MMTMGRGEREEGEGNWQEERSDFSSGVTTGQEREVVGGSKIKEVVMSSFKETGDDGVVNSGEIASRDVLVTIDLGTGARPR